MGFYQIAVRLKQKSKKRRQKNICPHCRKKMRISYDECIFCGGGEYYECPRCLGYYDITTGEEL